MITREIGTRFEFEGVLLEVVEARRCGDCYFYERCNRSDCDRPEEAGWCSSARRTDSKPVKFVVIDKFKLLNAQIDDLLHFANQMEEDYAGRKEEEFYSGMIHALELIKEFIKRKFKSS